MKYHMNIRNHYETLIDNWSLLLSFQLLHCSFIQHRFIKHPLCASNCSRPQGYSREQNKNPCSNGAAILMRKDKQYCKNK